MPNNSAPSSKASHKAADGLPPIPPPALKKDTCALPPPPRPPLPLEVNLSATVPPHPSQMKRPPPFLELTVCITEGVAVGLLNDLKLLSFIVLQPGLTFKVCQTWDKGFGRYKADYLAGRVKITPRQKWHSLAAAIIGTQVPVPLDPIAYEYVPSTAPTPNIALAREKLREAAKREKAEKNRRAAQELQHLPPLKEALEEAFSYGKNSKGKAKTIVVSDSHSETESDNKSSDSDAFEVTSPLPRPKPLPLHNTMPVDNSVPNVFSGDGAPFTQTTAVANEPRRPPSALQNTQAPNPLTSTGGLLAAKKVFPPLDGLLPPPMPFITTAKASAAVVNRGTASAAPEGAKRPRCVQLYLNEEMAEKLYEFLGSTTPAQAPAPKKQRTLESAVDDREAPRQTPPIVSHQMDFGGDTRGASAPPPSRHSAWNPEGWGREHILNNWRRTTFMPTGEWPPSSTYNGKDPWEDLGSQPLNDPMSDVELSRPPASSTAPVADSSTHCQPLSPAPVAGPSSQYLGDPFTPSRSVVGRRPISKSKHNA